MVENTPKWVPEKRKKVFAPEIIRQIEPKYLLSQTCNESEDEGFHNENRTSSFMKQRAQNTPIQKSFMSFYTQPKSSQKQRGDEHKSRNLALQSKESAQYTMTNQSSLGQSRMGSPLAYRSVMIQSKPEQLGCQQVRVKSSSRKGLLTPKYWPQQFDNSFTKTPLMSLKNLNSHQNNFCKSGSNSDSRVTTASFIKSPRSATNRGYVECPQVTDSNINQVL